ncbi:EAL domain-containing protein [Erythrobacter sp. F6033]|uniref:EAL domain-containing protein n=1 Tax=Erythrobacter sp. F6033 TaxID=2926401 RepID=UPI001FF3576F|nr:EAL domain-containing protein [Erythrobacter sp. F6033]MCK0127657.1 EAL domain-containing protein [Erythrobacter sp. F6033]
MRIARSIFPNVNARISAWAFVIAAAAACLMLVSGIGNGIENSVRDGRDTLRISPASGEIAIVEIDGRSLLELNQWPWPRSHYAKAVAELDRLGAEQIAFDVDFSSHSNQTDDQSLASAFASIDQPVILPTFRQVNQTADGEVYSEALPIPEFREHAFLASVNVFPSADGHITFYPNGVTTSDMPRPSLPNMLAKKAGAVGEFFRIDQAIDVETIPRVSFIDLLEGRVAREDVQGKRFVFGATAIELGDRYPTALFGVKPGVVIQAQAAETLLQDRSRGDLSTGLTLALVFTMIAAALIWASRSNKAWSKPTQLATACAIGLIGTALMLDQASMIYIPLSGSILFLGAFVFMHRTLNAAANLRAERMTDTASGIGNAAAMAGALKRHPTAHIAVARIADFVDVMTVLGTENIAQLDRQIVKRLELLAGDAKVYRIDSGIFGWLVTSGAITDPDNIFASARALFTSPIEVENERFRISANFGWTDTSIEGALHASADARKRDVVWSSNTETIHESAQFRQRLLGELDDALENGSISVVYQPKLRLNDNLISSAECLVRWDSPKLGRISPAEFIPLLETKHRIKELTVFVMGEAMSKLDAACANGFALNIAVNISAQLLSDDDFLDEAESKLKTINNQHDGSITLEITESAPLVDSVKARNAIERLRAAGARISIDDYGTGQATLNYLQDFPAHELKLDQSFIRGMVENRNDRIMVESTLELAHALNFDVVAEGVEDAATLAALRDLGCDYAQGWHIGKPMVWDDFLAMATDKPAMAAVA